MNLIKVNGKKNKQTKLFLIIVVLSENNWSIAY